MTGDTTVVALRQPDEVEDPLTAVLRSGARRLLAQAVEAEVEAFLAEMRDLRLPDGRERLVRHGYGTHPPRGAYRAWVKLPSIVQAFFRAPVRTGKGVPSGDHHRGRAPAAMAG